MKILPFLADFHENPFCFFLSTDNSLDFFFLLSSLVFNYIPLIRGKYCMFYCMYFRIVAECCSRKMLLVQMLTCCLAKATRVAKVTCNVTARQSADTILLSGSVKMCDVIVYCKFL